ncbi:MAG: lamin tail domain-containing protein [Bacteroidetes bacterium]|nr:lamin tail domain-containing protein [Bacteroidota bacterium]
MKKIFTLVLIIAAFTLQSRAQSNLVINEIDYDQPSVDSAEFIELYNASGTAVNLGDYTVVLFNGNSTSNVIYDSFPLPAQTLNAGDYFVICGGGGKVPNCDLTLNAISNIIQNGSPDAVALRENQTLNIVDVVSYEGSCIAPYVSGNGLPLSKSDTLQTDSIAGRLLGISRFPDGNDTNDDSTDFNRVCITPGYANLNSSTNCVTGLSTPKSTLAISVYPNPSRGIVTIDYKATSNREVKIRVSDILGNELKNITLKNVNKQGQVDLSEYQNGIYFIKVEAANGQSVKRIILNR